MQGTSNRFASERQNPLPKEGLYTTLKSLLANLLSIVHTRLELLASEIEEEKFRLLGLLFFACTALFFLMTGLVLLVCLLAAIFWEQRVIVFAVAGVGFLLLALLLMACAFWQIRRRSPLFSASLAEIREDLRQLNVTQPRGGDES